VLQSALPDATSATARPAIYQSKKIRARLNASDSEPGEPWPAKPYLMSRKVYQRHLRQLMRVEAAIFSLERIASPRYRRWRWRNRDGSFCH
jgi:hypothetical protein